MDAGLLISFCTFLVLFLGIGAFAARYSQGSESDYLLGGRSFGRWMVALSAGATGNTSFILIAAVGLGYTQGFGAFLLTLAFLSGELVFWSFFAKRISQQTEDTKAETVAELVTTNLKGPGASKVRSIVSLLIFVFIGAYLVAQFAGSAKILNVFFGVSVPIGVTIALVAILAYCTTGGLRASIWTDFAQAIIMIAMTVGMMVYALLDVGGVSALVSGLGETDPTLLNVTRGHSIPTLIAFFIGFAAMGAGFGLSQPHMTVRIMAGSSPKEVKRARWIYIGFIYLTWGAMVIFGICCRLLLSNISDPEQSLPVYAMNNFEPWIIGLVLAGMFSTIASSADSQILACSSAIARDFSPKLDSAMTKRFGLGYQQAATVVTGVLAALVTVYSSSTVFELVVFSVSVLTASVGAAMLITIFNRPVM
jgi:sodium/proline symporter